MAEFLLKYADTRGQIHQQVAHAGSERELRDRFTQQGFLIYSIKGKRAMGLSSDISGGLFDGGAPWISCTHRGPASAQRSRRSICS